MWLKKSSCEAIVNSAWEEGVTSNTIFPIMQCLDNCRMKLDAWNKNVFGHVGHNLDRLQKRLQWLELQSATPEIIASMRETRVELNCWRDKAESMWHQRSRISWLQSGDKNTNQRDVENVVIRYYSDLFKSSCPMEFEEILSAVQPKVNPSMNQKLTCDFQESEVCKALKQMYTLKSPGPDGMPPLFFQHFWPTVGQVVTKTVLDFFNFVYAVWEYGGSCSVSRGPSISHLFFADDSLIFCIASLEECDSLQRILKVYEEALGQQMNRAKTSLFFSQNTRDGVKEEIKTRFGAQIIRQHEKYLGLPSLVGRNEKNSFNDIKEKLEKKLAGWKEKLLSKAGRKPSFVWRSLMAAQKIVQKGLCWRVGNGRNIKIWEDSWVPSSSIHKIISPRGSFPLISRVSDLIDADQKCWNLNKLNRIFLPFEADEIASIPLSIRLPDDKQVWAATSTGLFSVRSAYHLALNIEEDEGAGSTSDGGHLRSFWKQLWSCQIPHKIRHFAWRAARDILPTKANLVARKILEDSNCEECGLCAESFYHLFWECSKARDTWAHSPFLSPLSAVPFSSFFDFLWYIIMESGWSVEDVGLAITIAWALWSNRNEMFHGKPRKAAWTPPTFPSYKVNVDAARFMAQKAVGAGVIIRDHEGNFIAELSQKFHAPLGTVEAEGKAFEAGILFAKQMGIRDLVLEGDSVIVVQALKQVSNAPSTVSSLI
ncbi:uncharacterized protein LOC142622019 [Castanea sativa]|uniref:uncharacterized protein LOC142622019 n=1 Tax=Castanea sativa TaxID=21020 RepID=UPI003F64AF28